MSFYHHFATSVFYILIVAQQKMSDTEDDVEITQATKIARKL